MSLTTTEGPVTGERYAIVSADGHAGADVDQYKPYLAETWHDEFDAWAATYEHPFADLLEATAYRNWDSDRRLEEMDADGVVAEVLFPNSVPPFFEESNLVATPPTDEDYERRWAGLQAHNRWMSDFCAATPGRRAGVLQIFVNRIDDAVAEIRWAKEHYSMLAGVMLPSIPPNSHLPPLWEDHYDGLWEVCQELDVPIHIHGGSGQPEYGEHPTARVMMLVELPWFAHRPIWHLIFGGVVEKYPGLRFVLTEQGVAWLPRGLETLDWFYRRMTLPGAAEASFFGAAVADVKMPPSQYFSRNFFCGASFIRPTEAALRHEIGIDRLMWGSDYPHWEGSYPYTTEALRVALEGVPEAEVRAIVETNPANFYGFDLAALRPVADEIGPTVEEIATPLAPEDYPSDSTCNAFDTEQVLRAW